MMSSADNRVSPPGLKLAKLWYLLGGLMLLMVGTVSLVPAPDIGVGDKLSHLFTYFFLAGWFSLLATNRASLGWTVTGNDGLSLRGVG